MNNKNNRTILYILLLFNCSKLIYNTFMNNNSSINYISNGIFFFTDSTLLYNEYPYYFLKDLLNLLSQEIRCRFSISCYKSQYKLYKIHIHVLYLLKVLN